MSTWKSMEEDTVHYYLVQQVREDLAYADAIMASGQRRDCLRIDSPYALDLYSNEEEAASYAFEVWRDGVTSRDQERAIGFNGTWSFKEYVRANSFEEACEKFFTKYGREYRLKHPLKE